MQMDESVIDIADKVSSKVFNGSENYSNFSFTIIKTTESNSLVKKSKREAKLSDLFTSIHKKLFPRGEIYDFYLENDDQKAELIIDKILAEVDQLLTIKNKFNALKKNMLNKKEYININDNNRNRKSPNLKKIKIEKNKKNCNNFKKIAQSVRVFEKTEDKVINPLNSNETKYAQNLNLINPPLSITRNQRKMTFYQKHFAKKIKSEKFIFKNIERNIKKEIIGEEKKRPNSFGWKAKIKKIVYVIRHYS